MFSPYTRTSTPFSTNTTSTYQAPLNNLFAPIAHDCSAMWLKAIENIDLDNTQVEVELINVDLVKQDTQHVLNLLKKIQENLGNMNINHKVGTSQGDRVIHGILKKYPYLFDTTNTREPTTLEILMHIHICLNRIFTTTYVIAYDFSELKSWLDLSSNINYSMDNFQEINPVVYHQIKHLVSKYGDDELVEYFSDGNKAIDLVLISLHNTYQRLLISGKKYETLLRQIESMIVENTGKTLLALTESEEIKSEAAVRTSHAPNVKCSISVKFSIKKIY